MAISPKTKYPIQTDDTDAGYPYGKAKNQAVAGDGTGTPWEATVVNDLFGFQQALLAAASIVPSGNPDKVGASQYLTALNTLIAAYGNTLAGLLAAKTAFTSNTYEWAGVHTFGNAVNVSDALQLTTPVPSKSLIPLREARGGIPTGELRFATDRIQAKGDGTNAQTVQFPIRLPTYSTLQGVRVGGKSNATPMGVTIRSNVAAINTGQPGSYNELPLLAPATITGGPNYVTANISGGTEIIANEATEYWVDVNVGSSSATYAEIYFVQVAWTWAALTNQ